MAGTAAAVGGAGAYGSGAETAARAGRPPQDAARLALRNRDRSAVVAPHGMLCASQPLAAITTNAAIGLMEPASCGIGGDLFAIVWSERERSLHGLNASGRAPAAWTLEKARELGLERIPRKSPLSPTVWIPTVPSEAHCRLRPGGIP
jgi:gamma-glutamyltranspeptidase/glutathione hydrolase